MSPAACHPPLHHGQSSSWQLGEPWEVPSCTKDPSGLEEMRRMADWSTFLAPRAQGCRKVMRDGTSDCQPSKTNTQGALLFARLLPSQTGGAGSLWFPLWAWHMHINVLSCLTGASKNRHGV